MQILIKRAAAVSFVVVVCVVLGVAAAPAPKKSFCEMDICVNRVSCEPQELLQVGCDYQGVYCVTYSCSDQ